jgi:hypothetical protein
VQIPGTGSGRTSGRSDARESASGARRQGGSGGSAKVAAAGKPGAARCSRRGRRRRRSAPAVAAAACLRPAAGCYSSSSIWPETVVLTRLSPASSGIGGAASAAIAGERMIGITGGRPLLLTVRCRIRKGFAERVGDHLGAFAEGRQGSDQSPRSRPCGAFRPPAACSGWRRRARPAACRAVPTAPPGRWTRVSGPSACANLRSGCPCRKRDACAWRSTLHADVAVGLGDLQPVGDQAVDPFAQFARRRTGGFGEDRRARQVVGRRPAGLCGQVDGRRALCGGRQRRRNRQQARRAGRGGAGRCAVPRVLSSFSPVRTPGGDDSAGPPRCRRRACFDRAHRGRRRESF